MAYALLNKVGSHKEGTSIMIGDRVRKITLAGVLVYENIHQCLINRQQAVRQPVTNIQTTDYHQTINSKMSNQNQGQKLE